MAPPRLLARPLVALAAGLLVAGLVQAAPASADEPAPPTGLAVTVTAVGVPGGAGATEEQPADLGVAPASATLEVLVTNNGPDDVSALTLDSASVANGLVTAPVCDVTELAVGQGATCTAALSGVASGSPHESTFTANGTVGDPATPISAGVSFFATASEPVPVPLGTATLAIAAPTSAVVGANVTVSGSLTRDGAPYAASVVLERQVDGSSLWTPVTEVVSTAGALSTTVTADRSATYRFDFAGDSTTSAATSPTVRVTVVPKQTVALTASAPGSAITGSTITVKGTIKRGGKAFGTTTQLQRLVGDGAWTTLKDVTSSSTGALSTTVKADRTAAFRYSFAGNSTTSAATSPTVRVTVVPKQTVALTASAPGSAITGSTITVKGSIKRAGKAYKTTTQLERQIGDGAWTTVKNVTSTSKGALSATVKADRTAGYRYRYAGTSTVATGTSNVERITVRKAIVKLSVDAPASVTQGKSIKIKGSIKREGKGYRTTTVLEFRAGGGWAKVRSVTSSSKGALSTSVKPSRSGEYRYRFAGNGTTAAGQSAGDRVTVKPKPPAKPKPKAYKNCTALNKVYPHGVGRSGAKDKGGHVTDFVRDTATYNLNTKSDRDKDGIACEKP